VNFVTHFLRIEASELRVLPLSGVVPLPLRQVFIGTFVIALIREKNI